MYVYQVSVSVKIAIINVIMYSSVKMQFRMLKYLCEVSNATLSRCYIKIAY